MIQEIARESSRKIVDTKVSGISFSEIPGQTALFTTYLKDPSSLTTYYPNVRESPLEVASYIPTVLSKYQTDRGELCDALERINSGLGAGDPTRSNIELLRRDDVVAVLTGQQAGLFGGPLYTVYKAISAIKLAAELSAAGTPAVPVFWMATEDHDLDEVSTASFLEASGKTHSSSYRPSSYIQNSPVGLVEIDDGISMVVNELLAALAPTGFSDGVRSHIETTWRAGNSLGRAFGETITYLFSSHGLIVLDPLDLDLKRLAAPIYKLAVERSDEMVRAIASRNRELETVGYHSQVKVEDDYFPLFWHDENGGRTSIRKDRSGAFRTKTQRDQFTREELLSLAEHDPQRLSPGVMLRPVVQDYLLPTVAYFGGGAEIAYFAQNSAAYEVLERPVTPIFHRQSFTVIEPKGSRTIEKLSLGYNDLFKQPESVIMEWSAKHLDPKTAAIFSSAEEAVNTELHRIDQLLAELDPTLLNNAATRRRKMLYHIGALRKKALLAFGRKNGDAERRILELFDAVMPDGHLQERSINVFYFINRYGPEFMKRIYDAADLTDKRHRILEMLHE